MTCSCRHLRVGSVVVEHKNWNPDCEEHGLNSKWYNSPEQIQNRSTQNERLRELYRQAKEARQRIKEES